MTVIIALYARIDFGMVENICNKKPKEMEAYLKEFLKNDKQARSQTSP